MNLILWRHAEAEDSGPGQDDMERALTAKGRKQARKMADWLNARLPAGARIIASPALRARQTADALDRPYQVAPAIAPGAGVESLCKAAHWPQPGNTTVLVGHQPDLGRLAAYLMTGATGAWAIRKAGIWWLRGRQQNGSLDVVIEAVVNPELK
ncbi:MAG: phosphohistidine phosphatase SixA [Rhodocyclaceae bacterium]|nr:phosphohistidine phosphatase SixA [Rhodocyclaceae bacterium]